MSADIRLWPRPFASGRRRSQRSPAGTFCLLTTPLLPRMFLLMSTPAGVSEAHPADGCAEMRAEVGRTCREAHEARAAHEAAAANTHELRRELVASQHRQAEAAVAADPQFRSADKKAARDTYQLARYAAQSEDEIREATAAWAQAVDRINRAGRLAQRAAAQAKAAVASVESSLHEAEQAERSARITAERAEGDCLDARVRLAACEEEAAAPAEAASATVFEPHAATGGHAIAVSPTERMSPLVIELMVSADRRALELAANDVAARTGCSPAEAQLQLQELVDAIVSAAAEEGFLIFDSDHRFWATLTFEEARDVIAALARLGFSFAPSEGWYAGRAPAPADLSMALAYAGLDARNMRDLPDSEDLRQLPGSIGVDGRAYLAARAPSLAMDQLVSALGVAPSRSSCCGTSGARCVRCC